MVTPYVTLKGHPEFMRNQTGFGYMVYDIARAVAKTEEVDLLATDTCGEAFISDQVKFLKRSLWVFLVHINKNLPLSSILSIFKRYPQMQRGTRLRLAYYWLMSGYLYNILKVGHYDVVHIHGCGFSTEVWMQACKRCGQKFVVTLHGLNSFSDTVKLESAGKQYERDFLKRVTDGEFPITVISSGMKRLIENTYGVRDCNNITVVCNSFNFGPGGGKFSIRDLYQLPHNSKIILYVGNVSVRKNQGQLIKAFALLPKEIASNTFVLFLGGVVEEKYNIRDLSKGIPYKDHFIVCGVVPKEMVSTYYQQGDAVALMSLSEGFGLSLIEGMHFGLPAMSFADVDAYEDIYDPCAMVGVKEHTDKAVANGLEALLTKDWKKQKIKDYSKKFEPENMAKQYVEVYQQYFVKN